MNVQLSSGDGTAAHVDQALWARLQPGASRSDFLNAWLTLQCRIVGDVRSAAIVLPDRNGDRFVPAAVWPPDEQPDPSLGASVELAMAEGRGVLRPLKDSPDQVSLALPYLVDGDVVGAVVMCLGRRGDAKMRLAMRQLQWSAGWIELMKRREALADTGRARARSAAALEIVVAMLEAPKCKAAAMAVATSTARLLDCDRVSIGLVGRGRVRVVALSHAADLGRDLYLAGAIRGAMEEAIDQGAAVFRSAGRRDEEEDEACVSRAHAALIRSHGAMATMTLPLVDGDRVIGAMTLEHRDADGLDEAKRDLARGIGAIVGPILEQKRLNDRSLLGKAGGALRAQLGRMFGPAYLGRKLVLLALIGVAVFLHGAHGQFEVAADAQLEGRVQRVISAPFDGYLVEQLVRPGDIVEEGALLARFDDRDLHLQVLAADAELRELRIQLHAALADARRTEQALLEAQIAQAEAKLDLMRSQLERAALRAPFAGVVVSGDRTRELGAAVNRGEELFVIAPLDDYRITLLIDEREIGWVEEGQSGEVRFASMPDVPVEFTVTRIMPVATVVGGVNRFPVEAEVETSPGAPRLLPGMEGVGRVSIGERRLVWIWTRDAVEWLRMALWRWWP